MSLRIRRTGGFLLPETFIAMAIFSAISLALMLGFTSLERNFAATTDFATNHTDSVRISDYLALDLRRALSIQSSQNNTVINIPSYYDDTGQPRNPMLDAQGNVIYGSAGDVVQIRYYLQGGAIYRKVGSDPAVAIAENVSDFIFNVTDLGKVANTSITFNPIFKSTGATASAIAATAVHNTTLLRNSRTDITSSVY